MVPVPTTISYGPTELAENAAGASRTESAAPRRKCVVVGLGMVGIAFIEKLLAYDLEGGRDEWEVTV